MPLVIPTLIGEPIELFPPQHERTALKKYFQNPETRVIDDYILFHSFVNFCSIIMPITKDFQVVALRHFRHGSNQVMIELPGGTGQENETPIQAVIRELKEETGYQAQAVTLLHQNLIFFEPQTLNSTFYAFVAEGCTIADEEVKRNDDNEYCEPMLVPLNQWKAMVRNGEVVDAKSIVVTHLALCERALAP